MIVDEASIAGTLDLDQIITQARDAGAKVLLVGDWAQLSPVTPAARSSSWPTTDPSPAPCTTSAGSATNGNAPPPSSCAPATRPSSTSTCDHDRVESGDREDMLDLLFELAPPTPAPACPRS